MTLNKSKGNMYLWVTHTWNPIKGKCPHECIYCYVPDVMRGKPQGELRLDEKCLKDNLGSGKKIFVGSGTDMWAEEVPAEWITRVLSKLVHYKNVYLFQSKYPHRFLPYLKNGNFPYSAMFILGVTMETNRWTDISKAPPPIERYQALIDIPRHIRVMVSIEPIMDFDLDDFISLLKNIHPHFVSIGADSKGHKLPEPSPEKIRALIEELKKFTEVKIKDNLARILKAEEK